MTRSWPVVIKNAGVKMSTLEELENQRDLLDSKIKKLEMLERTAVFTIYLILAKEQSKHSSFKNILHFDNVEQVGKIKHFLTELIKDD